MMTTQDKSTKPILLSTDWGGQAKNAAEAQKKDVSPTSVDDDDGQDEDESESTGSETELGSDSEEEDEEQEGEEEEEGGEVEETVKTTDDNKVLRKTQREESDPALTELLRGELRKIIPTEIRKIIQEECKRF